MHEKMKKSGLSKCKIKTQMFSSLVTFIRYAMVQGFLKANLVITIFRICTWVVLFSWFIVAPIVCSGVLCLILVLSFSTFCTSSFCNHLGREKRNGCFALTVFLKSCASHSSVALPHVCGVWLWYFLIILTCDFHSADIWSWNLAHERF